MSTDEVTKEVTKEVPNIVTSDVTVEPIPDDFSESSFDMDEDDLVEENLFSMENLTEEEKIATIQYATLEILISIIKGDYQKYPAYSIHPVDSKIIHERKGKTNVSGEQLIGACANVNGELDSGIVTILLWRGIACPPKRLTPQEPKASVPNVGDLNREYLIRDTTHAATCEDDLYKKWSIVYFQNELFHKMASDEFVPASSAYGVWTICMGRAKEIDKTFLDTYLYRPGDDVLQADEPCYLVFVGQRFGSKLGTKTCAIMTRADICYFLCQFSGYELERLLTTSNDVTQDKVASAFMIAASELYDCESFVTMPLQYARVYDLNTEFYQQVHESVEIPGWDLMRVTSNITSNCPELVTVCEEILA